jgi:uncharacterized protein YcfJ
MDDDDKRQGRNDYDWINGMRIGMIVGAIVGVLIGVALGGFPFIWFIIGTASGGYLGAKMAPRW